MKHFGFTLAEVLITLGIIGIVAAMTIPSLNSKIIKRGYKFVVYVKNGDNISDILKMFKATESLFFFEDIRIYRDHKNMVNRLNNCELSNQTKSIQTGLKQLNEINYIIDNDLLSLIDDNTVLSFSLDKIVKIWSYK